MLLSDKDIIRAMESGRINISPVPDLSKQLGSCSIDLHLGNTFRIFEHSKYSHIDLRSDFSVNELMRKVEISDGDAFIIQPGDFVLAATRETLEFGDDIMGRQVAIILSERLNEGYHKIDWNPANL